MPSRSIGKPKRKRWFRFSLRTFLIVVTILVIGGGWYVHRTERQRVVVRWVGDNWGDVHYDFEFDSDRNYIRGSQPPVPNWLTTILDIDYFSSVVSVNLESTQVSDLTPLANLTNLAQLDFGTTSVTDLAPLTKAENLEYLSLVETSVNDLTPLSGLTNLEYLSLNDTQVSDLKPLSGLTNLETLFLNGTQVSDLKPLSGLTNLKELRLRKTLVSDLTPLAGLTNLSRLIVRGTQISELEITKLQEAIPNCRIIQ